MMQPSLMSNEISYLFQPSYFAGKFEKLSEDDFREIGSLAKLMVNLKTRFCKTKAVL
jgi:hypothetical protein